MFKISTKKSGGMDMDLLKEFVENDLNSIIILSMGSTLKQTYDDIKELYEKVIYKLPGTRFHIHIDGSYGGLVYPFLKKEWLVYPFHTFNVSFHRHLCLKQNCSLLITKKELGLECCDISTLWDLTESSNALMTNLNESFIYDHVTALQEKFILREYFVKHCKNVLLHVYDELSLNVHLKAIPNICLEYHEKYKSIIYNKTASNFDCSFSIQSHTTKEMIDEIVKSRF
jgi:hypothetical protein